jgi:DNA-binding response OmpR family regulator
VAASVLVLDDQESMREVMAETLRLGGYRVVTASTGEEALALAQVARPDLILADACLPGMEGLEFCKRVRRECDAPVIMISGMGQIELADEEQSLIHSFIPKPFGLRELLEEVGATLERARTARL